LSIKTESLPGWGTRVLSTGKNITVVKDCDLDNETKEIIEAIYPDVALVDINFTFRSGIELTQQICRRIPRVKVVILSAFPMTTKLFQAMKQEAAAYLSKAFPPRN